MNNDLINELATRIRASIALDPTSLDLSNMGLNEDDAKAVIKNIKIVPI